MKFSKFHKAVQDILKIELPSSQAIVNAGQAMAKDIRIGRTAFMRKMGVASELEYKKRCMQQNTIMFHAHIGMNTWNATAAALALLDHSAEKNGFVVDRAGICLDRRMGLPKAHRKNIPAETGPMLDSIKDWKQVGQTAPIQPHMGDQLPKAKMGANRPICGDSAAHGRFYDWISRIDGQHHPGAASRGDHHWKSIPIFCA